MAKPCGYCKSIPWENIKSWRPNDGENDPRPIVDYARLNRESCFVCRTIGKALEPWQDLPLRLTYHDAKGKYAGSYDGFLTVDCGSGDGPGLRNLSVFGEKSPHASCERRKFVNYQALSESMIKCGKGWSGDHWHASCGPEAASGIRNMVVIDCKSNALVFAAPDCKYLALSYVWGTSSEETHYVSLPQPTGQLLSATRKVVESAGFSDVRQVMPERVPRVVYDAIVVTTELGFRYLWIDRYCIDQQDADTKHQQIQQMWSIYASAYITLIAAAGNGPNHGLPGVSLPRRQDRVKHGEVTIADNLSIAEEIRTSIWASRAWTFQENLASRRKIFFTDMGASYACEAYFITDLGQTILQQAERLDYDNYEELRGFLGSEEPLDALDDKTLLARRNVEAYCARSLTYDSDSLNAIMGMLVRLSQREVDPVDHVWGTLLIPVKPSSSVDCYNLCLYWHHERTPRRRDGFPTWSPLAWEGRLYQYPHFPWHSYCDLEPSRKIYLLQEDGDVDLNTYAHSRRDALGRIQADVTATLAPTLLKFESARVIPISLQIVNGNPSIAYEVAVQQSDAGDLVLESYWDLEPHGIETGLIGIVFFDGGNGDVPIMVLKPVNNHYERIGMAHVAAKDRTRAFWSEYTDDVIVG